MLSLHLNEAIKNIITIIRYYNSMLLTGENEKISRAKIGAKRFKIEAGISNPGKRDFKSGQGLQIGAEQGAMYLSTELLRKIIKKTSQQSDIPTKIIQIILDIFPNIFSTEINKAESVCLYEIADAILAFKKAC